MNRCCDRQTFDKCVAMVNGFKEYLLRHGQPVYENPSPGNHEGGITTLEEKSLGCLQKGGTTPVVDVLPYGGRLARPGLNLVAGPGNDPVSTTALVAAGCQMVLFSTGRGTPFGGPVPTPKIASNTPLAERKSGWIDFDAGRLVAGASMAALADELLALVVDIASGRRLARNEINGYRQIAHLQGRRNAVTGGGSTTPMDKADHDACDFWQFASSSGQDAIVFMPIGRSLSRILDPRLSSRLTGRSLVHSCPPRFPRFQRRFRQQFSIVHPHDEERSVWLLGKRPVGSPFFDVNQKGTIDNEVDGNRGKKPFLPRIPVPRHFDPGRNQLFGVPILAHISSNPRFRRTLVCPLQFLEMMADAPVQRRDEHHGIALQASFVRVRWMFGDFPFDILDHSLKVLPAGNAGKNDLIRFGVLAEINRELGWGTHAVAFENVERFKLVSQSVVRVLILAA